VDRWSIALALRSFGHSKFSDAKFIPSFEPFQFQSADNQKEKDAIEKGAKDNPK
jgi:hypothetical protein